TRHTLRRCRYRPCQYGLQLIGKRSEVERHGDFIAVRCLRLPLNLADQQHPNLARITATRKVGFGFPELELQALQVGGVWVRKSRKVSVNSEAKKQETTRDLHELLIQYSKQCATAYWRHFEQCIAKRQRGGLRNERRFLAQISIVGKNVVVE